MVARMVDLDDCPRSVETTVMLGEMRGQGRTAAGAIAIGFVVASLAWIAFPFTHGADFAQFHFHARNWLAGHDPYAGGFPILRRTKIVPEPFFYPFPSLFVLAPFALFPLRLALALFIGASSAVLAWGILAKSPERLPMLFGAGFILAAGLGQWTPLVTATLLIPALAWLAVVKPNVGVASIAADPSAVRILGGGALLLVSLAFQPNWPGEWLRNLASMPPHPTPILLPGGFLALFALARWRRPEARLLVAMACVPQLMYFADQLPLWLVARTRRESMLLSATSLVAWSISLQILNRPGGGMPQFNSDTLVLLGVYAPALVMVLRRPNAGPLPQTVERRIARWPAWLRGRRVDGSTGGQVDG
jgi:hypothetical protein